MQTKEIREKFITYFKQRGHHHSHSSPVIPSDDPTLLFTNAGMNQFKDLFLGQETAEYTTAVTSQKCIRAGGKHNDLDNVGHTTRHATFFEMLGNFSFGDYFKQEAIQYAWELSTRELGIDEERIWASVYEKDDEAYELWKAYLPEKRIVRLGEADNFWRMGDTGPCGPCTELLFDRGPAFSDATTPHDDVDGERFFEFWNLVFMQFNKDASGKMVDLAKKGVDTGMGLERIALLKQGVGSIFETDILRELIASVENLSGVKYDSNDQRLAPAFHVIADHLRMLSFAIADGGAPGSVDRGYVLRKVLRRLVRYARMLGFHRPFLGKLYPKLILLMGDDYPELKSAKIRIDEIFQVEEEAFIKTLQRGGTLLDKVIQDAQASKRHQIHGEDAFKLKDTYGLPIDEILLIAKDNGLEVNLESFQLLEEEAKERSKAAHDKVQQIAAGGEYEEFAQKHGTTEFVGYTDLTQAATITGILIDGKWSQRLEAGQTGSIFLDKTAFYATSGGQVCDTGYLAHHSARFKVKSCQSPFTGLTAHTGTVEHGTFLVGEPLYTEVDSERRKKIAHSHTGTHLLHWALCEVLGEGIKQAGSLVEPSKLRFDFTYHKAVSEEQLLAVEEMVNAKILQGGRVQAKESAYADVQKRKDIKQLFGEKYRSIVRVVSIEEFSKELCGGTHVQDIQEIGLFRICKESSIAAGVRRIEAVTDSEAIAFTYEREHLLKQIAADLKTDPPKLREKLHALQEELARQKTLVKEMRTIHLRTIRNEIIDQKESIGPFEVLIAEVDVLKEELIPLANELNDRLQDPSALLLITKSDDRCQVLIKCQGEQLHAGKLVQELATLIGGRGGGKPEIAQAGGTNLKGIAELISAFRQRLHDAS